MLSGVAYAPVAVVACGYYDRQIAEKLDGFGFLVPRSEKVRTLGTVWNSSLFAGRAPAGSVAITSFIGGATDPKIMECSEDEIAAIVQDENARILQISGSPVASAVWKYPKALPQYNLGHGHVVEAIRDGERANAWIVFLRKLPRRPFAREMRGDCKPDGARNSTLPAIVVSEANPLNALCSARPGACGGVRLLRHICVGRQLFRGSEVGLVWAAGYGRWRRR